MLGHDYQTKSHNAPGEKPDNNPVREQEKTNYIYMRLYIKSKTRSECNRLCILILSYSKLSSYQNRQIVISPQFQSLHSCQYKLSYNLRHLHRYLSTITSFIKLRIPSRSHSLTPPRAALMTLKAMSVPQRTHEMILSQSSPSTHFQQVIEMLKLTHNGMHQKH